VDSALQLVEDTLAADDFPSTVALLAAADQAALKLRHVGLVSTIRKRQAEVAVLHKEFAHWEPFAQKLAKNPNDAEANSEMGYYHGLIKGNWEKGLPMLARGKGAVADLARLDLGAKTPADVLAMAVDWEEFGKSSR